MRVLIPQFLYMTFKTIGNMQMKLSPLRTAVYFLDITRPLASIKIFLPYTPQSYLPAPRRGPHFIDGVLDSPCSSRKPKEIIIYTKCKPSYYWKAVFIIT